MCSRISSHVTNHVTSHVTDHVTNHVILYLFSCVVNFIRLPQIQVFVGGWSSQGKAVVERLRSRTFYPKQVYWS